MFVHMIDECRNELRYYIYVLTLGFALGVLETIPQDKKSTCYISNLFREDRWLSG